MLCVENSLQKFGVHTEQIKNGENIVLYRLDKLDELPDKCRYLLRHPRKAKAIAEAGKRKAELLLTLVL